MTTYICDVCGYIYDPDLGDPSGNVEADTKFEDLPKEWACPECGEPKTGFSSS